MAEHRMNADVQGMIVRGNRLVAPKGMSKAKANRLRTQIRAWEHYHATGDDSKLIEAGLYPEEGEER